MENKTCEQCNKVIEPRRGERLDWFHKRRFCSHTCFLLFRRMDVEKVRGRTELNTSTGCWLWRGSKAPGGYGQIRYGGRAVMVHRFVWEKSIGPIPSGLVLDHICRVPACCNPEHLRVVTVAENNLAPGATGFSAVNARKIQCPKCGGSYDTMPDGGRRCLECDRRRMREYQRKRHGNHKDYSPAAVKKRLSESHLGQEAWNKGKQLSPEHRAKLAQVKSGKPGNWKKGRKRGPMSQEEKHKRSEAMKVYIATHGYWSTRPKYTQGEL